MDAKWYIEVMIVISNGMDYVVWTETHGDKIKNLATFVASKKENAHIPRCFFGAILHTKHKLQ